MKKGSRHVVEVELIVPFHDCDPLAVVWHGRYFEYMEAGRTALLRECGLDAPDMIELGLRMFVTDARCHYSHPLRYGDRLKVRSWFSQVEPLLRVAYEVLNISTGRKSARASTQLALTDEAGQLLPEVPASVRGRLPQEN